MIYMKMYAICEGDLLLYAIFSQSLSASLVPAPSTLDEDSPNSDTHLPSTLFTSLVHEQADTEEVQEWVDETVGDTHLGKQKTRSIIKKRKRVTFIDQIEEEEDEDNDDSTIDPSACHYRDDDNHGDVGGDVGSYGAGGSGAGESGMRDHITILLTCLSTITMTRIEYVSIVK
jgi:hypothetical protein